MPKRRPRIETVTIEAATLRAHVGHIVSATDATSQRLRDAGENLSKSVGGVQRGADTAELRAVATEIRGVALHALTLSGELLEQVGRLEEAAAVCEASLNRR